MTGRVIRQIARADQGQIDRLGSCGVSAVHEAQGQAGLLATRLRPVFAGARIAGSAVTVSVPPGDNLMIHVAMELIAPGDILIVSQTGPSDVALFGELLATSAIARGCRGLILDGAVRDVRDLAGLCFPVWATGVCATGPRKEGAGSVNLRLECAGALVEPGDILVADDDGVCVVPRGEAAAVLAEAEAREAREKTKRRRLAAGELGIDIDGLRPRLGELGVTEE